MSEAKCPFHHAAGTGTSNRDWWPNQLKLDILHQHSSKPNPMGGDFDYAKEFKSLDLKAVKEDLKALMIRSQEWWPADFGHYGGLMIRMAWHSAGTYRTADGRGGAGNGSQRFAPLNSWPDNGNLDKARRLLWPVKQKYGRKISWGDLMILAGNVALESMGFKTFGFGGGRVDIWEPEKDIYWGAEKKWLEDQRYSGDRELENPLAAVQMGLIYVNPEGPNGNPDPVAAAQGHPRNLRAHGHERRRDRGAHRRRPHLRQDPRRRPGLPRGPRARSRRHRGTGFRLEEQLQEGKGCRRDHQRPGSDVDHDADEVEQQLLREPVRYEWELTKSPAGAHQWVAKGGSRDRSRTRTIRRRSTLPTMLTTDLSLRFDPAYEKISRRFLEHPDQFADAFARAWFKLTHRDMGPRARYLGPEVPAEDLIWQDPIPTR